MDESLPRAARQVFTKFANSFWSVEIPDDWRGVEENSNVEFTALRNGVGALQISTHVNNDRAINSENLLELVEMEHAPASPVHVRMIGESPMAEITYYQDARFWRKIWIGENHVLLYITYNCQKDEETIEKDQVDQILSTLRIKKLGSPPNGG